MASITDQNWVVWNQGKNPLVNFNFMLRVELAFDLPCKSVRAFERELEYDFIQEGGLNDYVHMRRKPISKPFTLEVERYVGVDYVDPLPLGADLVLPLMLFVSRNHDQFIPFVVARTYVFTGCTVMKKTYGDLVADQSGLLVETTTIGYREMLCVDIPWSEVGDNIPGSVTTNPTRPTDAKTQDQSGENYKALARQFYEQAKAARERCDDEFKEADIDKLLGELEDVISRLEEHAGDSGPLQKAVADAEAGLKDADGKDRAKTASELQTKARTAKRELQEKEAAKADADDALTLAQLTEEELTEKKQAQEAQLETLKQALAQKEQADVSAQTVTLAAPDKAGDLVEPVITRFQDDSPAGADTSFRRLTPPEIAAQQEKELAEAAKKKLERDLKAAENALKATEKKLEAAAKETKAAEQKVSAAEKAVKEAQKALIEAEAQAAKAARDLALAEDRLSDAESDLKKAKEQLNRLQSQQTNLELHKDRAVSSQKSCGEEFQKCEEENTKVQAMTDEQEIYNGYQTVNALSKNTTYHERQVREAVQYMEITEKLIRDTEAMLPEAADETVSGDVSAAEDAADETMSETASGDAADDGNSDVSAAASDDAGGAENGSNN